MFVYISVSEICAVCREECRQAVDELRLRETKSHCKKRYVQYINNRHFLVELRTIIHLPVTLVILFKLKD